MATRPLMVRLDEADRHRLDSEADQLGMAASTLARVLLHATLAAPTHDPAARVADRMSALDRLADLRAKLPPVDAVRLIGEGRRDLARRSRTRR